MPIYEYRCTACGAELEKLQKLSDPPLLECPACAQSTLVKLVSASSFRLKGGGWYETDFKTGKKKNGAGDGASENAPADSGADKSAAATSGKTEKSASSSDSSKSSTDKTPASAG